MNREQNKKNKFQSFIKFVEMNFFQSTALSLNKETWISKISAPSKMAWIDNHKSFIRSKLVFPQTNFTTVLSILPFILGFSQFLNQKYSSQRNNLFFEQNIPGISLPTQKIDWDTFQYFVKQQKTPNFQQQISEAKITWSEKDIIISTNNRNLFSFASEKNLIAYLPGIKDDQSIEDGLGFQTTNSFLNPSLNSKWAKINLSTLNRSFNSYFYQSLDEIPSKLEANYSVIQNTRPLLFSSNLFLSDGREVDQSPNSNLVLNLKKLDTKNSLIGFNPKNLLKVDNLNKLKNINSRFYESIGDKKQNEFFRNEFFFKREMRKLFTDTNLIPINSFSENSKKLNQNSKNYASFFNKDDIDLLQETIRVIDKILIPKPIQFSRFMSGYQYPDMKLEEVIGFILQNKNSNISNLKILFSPSYLVPQISQFKYLQTPDYLIESKKLLLKDNLGREIFYEGPSVILDLETGFDWKIKFENGKNLRLWLENYLGSKNPSKESIKNFFGIFESPENQIEINPLRNINNNNYFQNLLLFQSGLITNTSPSYLPFIRSFQLPSISNENWEKQIINNFGAGEINSVQYNTVVLPIFEVRTPKIEKIRLPFGYQNLIDFEFIHPLKSFSLFSHGTRLSNNLNTIDFHINGSNDSKNYSFPIHLTSGKYQKIPSIFQNNSKVFFSDIWEPLTINSWLITAQIGFAFLVFKILKALADNYGRELLVYLLDLVALLGFLDDDLKQEIEILMGQREKGFRIISKTTKNFNNIGGIQNLLPEIVEIVWFLRNSGREFSISKTLPRGVLLTGPPGTGKTLLVQAIAGEAEVPVLALSGSSLLEPGESGALKLEILFKEARKVAPCIVFIDEMDTLAEKREQVLQNPMGADEILESLSHQKSRTNLNSPDISSLTAENSEELTDALFAQQDMHKEKLRILMQFLVELDGIQGRDGVVVIGATNRPEMLDPAILRPGRFDTILDLGLPGPEKRREILKLYSENLGIDQKISWNYLIHRTAGYSAADLAGIMNQSTLHAILKNSQHTVETIEYGIDRITTIGLEKPGKAEHQQVLSIQVAYYQAGKILLSALLEHHPPTLVTHLWPRRTNVRALKINENLQKYFFRFARRIELEHRIIGCYAGKAAEILFLQESLQLNNLSDLGTEDIQFAQNLIRYMIQNWYFYSKTALIHENTNIISVFNDKEYREYPDKVHFLNSVLETSELSLLNKGEQFGQNAYSSVVGSESSLGQDPQKYFPTASWQYQISTEFELSTRAFSDWYRLYLPDPQQTERNLEWTPPDEFYHGNDLSEKLTDSLNWNEISQVRIDYETHSLILQSFNKALLLLDQHREILDKLAYELLHLEILREPEVEKILSDFKLKLNNSVIEDYFNNITPNLISINNNWGNESRRPESQHIEIPFIKKF